MKNICLISMLMVLVTLFSCERKNTGYRIDGVPLTFAEYVCLDSCDAPSAKGSGMLRVDFRIAFVAEEDSDAGVAKAINEEIVAYEFGHQYRQGTMQQAIVDYVKFEKEEYLSLWGNITPDEDEEFQMNFEYSKSSGFVKGRGGVLCYETSDYIYEGGAHGIYGNWVLNFDCATGRLLAYSDVFAPDKDAHVRQIVQRYLLEMLNKEYDANVFTVQDLKAFGYVFEENLLPSASVFRLGEDGVTFIYGVYSIAPYVMGETFVTVPYEAIEHCIQKDVLEILER